MKKSLFLIMALTAAVTLISCGSSKVENSGSSDWVSCTEENMTQNYGKFYTTAELGQFSTLEVEMKKDSGYESSCFGIVFGYSDAKNGVLSNYVRFEINTLGEYAVYTWDGSRYKDLLDDSAVNTAYLIESNSINKGFGASNKLKIETTANDEYNCYLNGYKVASNVKPMDGTEFGAMAFFSVGKADQENFPDSPVKVSYKIIGSTAHK